MNDAGDGSGARVAACDEDVGIAAGQASRRGTC
jgi:hypothetical protein